MSMVFVLTASLGSVGGLAGFSMFSRWRGRLRCRGFLCLLGGFWNSRGTFRCPRRTCRDGRFILLDEVLGKYAFDFLPIRIHILPSVPVFVLFCCDSDYLAIVKVEIIWLLGLVFEDCLDLEGYCRHFGLWEAVEWTG
jgi:hypothetical protein